MSNLEDIAKQRATQWLDSDIENTDKEIIKSYPEKELFEAFYKDLEFGTGGLRGEMGIGTNRVNKYTIGKATQGLANYLKKSFADRETITVAIAHDSRNNSRFFMDITAAVLSANNINVLIFDELRPTPELSYVVREYNCQCGIVITASHNPKEYNGYKVYWEDGGQIVPPYDKEIIDSVNNVSSIDQIKFNANESIIKMLDNEVDDKYLDAIKSLSLNPDIIKKHSDIGIVYTPIHGTGYKLVPDCLNKLGFTNVMSVDEQNAPDGNFPTVKYPNPEERDALNMAIEKAEKTGADIVMGTDPDSDRVGIAVRDNNNKIVILNGNQTATLLFHYLLNQSKERGKLNNNPYIVKTIVTTDLLAVIANSFSVDVYDVLTGFKYIAEVMNKNQGKAEFIVGGEESFGYLAGDFVRDKDAVISCALIAETAVWAKENGKTLYQLLIDIYCTYGIYSESLLSLTKKGKEGADEIAAMMTSYRENTPKTINGSEVVKVIDHKVATEKDTKTAESKPTGLPQSNVLQFILADGSKISVRPSGTEPKIKFYFSVNDKLDSKENYEQVKAELDNRIESIKSDLGI